MIATLVEIVDAEATHYELVFWTPSEIDYRFLWLLKNDIKSVGNAALGEIADVEAVIEVDIDQDWVSVSG